MVRILIMTLGVRLLLLNLRVCLAYFILWLVLMLMSITWWMCNVATFVSPSMLSDERPHIDRL